LENHTSLINTVITDFKNELIAANDTVAQLNVLHGKVSQQSNIKIDEIDKAIAAADKRMQEIKRELETTLHSYNERFDAELSVNGEKITPIITQAKERIERLCESITSNHKDFQAKFEKLLERGEEILGIVSRDTFTHDYNKAAQEAQTNIKQWNKLAVWSMVSVATFTIIVFIISIVGDFNWTTIVSKMLVTTAGASISVYAYRQVAKHEKVERYSRRVALELAVFDPFISTLPKPEQDKLKQEIVMRLFGKAGQVEGSHDKQSLSNEMRNDE